MLAGRGDNLEASQMIFKWGGFKASRQFWLELDDLDASQSWRGFYGKSDDFNASRTIFRRVGQF